MKIIKMTLLISSFLISYAIVDSIAASPVDQAKKEIDTAIYHAKASADASSIGDMKSHLKHVINCMEGPEGKNFDSAEANPCKGQGNGIIPDLNASGSEGAEALGHAQEANNIAVASEGESDFHTLHGKLDEIISHLEEAKKSL